MLSYINPWSSHRTFYSDIKTVSAIFRGINGRTFEDEGGAEANHVNANVMGLANRNTFISATAKAYQKGVAPTAFKIQSRAKNKKFNRKFEKRIKQFSKRKNFEITGRYHRGSFERMMVKEFAVTSGGFILRHHYNPKWEFGYKVELVALRLIDTSKHSISNGLFNGIQVNEYGEITSIHIFTDTHMTSSTEVNAKDLTMVINMWSDIQQYSGISPVAPVLESLAWIDGYKASEMKGAKKRADNPIFIKTPHFTDILNAKLREIGTSAKAITSKAIEELFSNRRLRNSETESDYSYISNTEDVVETGKAVDSIYDMAFKNETRISSSSVGLTSSTTVGEPSKSYNDSLRGQQSEERGFKTIFEDIIELGWLEVFEDRLLNALVLKGKIDAPDYWSKPNKYRKLQFMRRETDHVDPTKTAKARTENLLNKSQNIVEILATDGKDYEESIDNEVMYELARKKAFEKSGLTYIQTGLESTITDEDLLNEDGIKKPKKEED